MGHRRYSAPRRGSLAFVPRARTKNIVAKVKSWPKSEDKIRILGFAGYKVGMTHVIMIEDLPGTPMFGREIVKPATIIETPPLYVVGLRTYSKNSGAIISSTELWAENLPKTLERVLTLPKNIDVKSLINKIETKLSEVIEIRLIVCTQPHKSGIGKKTPEIFEIKIDGGNVKERYEFAKKLLGSEINIKDIFKEGQYVDVISVSKGKGFQGVIKRYGV
ncbi:MAG: 50S ribosomal protein L3, partial [Candidatus Methanomethylicia archaeon]